MKKLEHFSVYDRNPTTLCVPKGAMYIASCLTSLTFPCLSTCSIDLPFDEKKCFDIIQFLARHSTVTHLSSLIHGAFQGHQAPIVDLLPDLKHYDGSIQLLPMLSPRCRLTEVRLRWSGYDDTILPVELLDPRLPIIVSLEDYHSSDYEVQKRTLSLLSENMSHVASLHVRIPGRPEAHTEVLERLVKCLPRFSDLKYLALDIPMFKPKDGKWLVPQLWADACPTLTACSIRHRASRKVDDGWEEYSTQEFEVEAGFSVFESFLKRDKL
ncbi:hypothetical protein FB45DRAFT_32252 [Roridomyces roridus]|uniref:Uncharacterized protein n=1 Tax=Roridomyces roridus TaxID=1738132 RepID=A0AAD7CLD0_9AGAR|nr:hypothetical protein FB45DRAFT_32252 [Roridomyces roridus]